MANNETELKIIEAGIRCIERWGIKKTTVREIAKEADVNLAAVNYHFGSKQELIERIMEETLSNAFDDAHIYIPDQADPKERLACIMEHLTKGILQYPHITRAHFYRPFLEEGADSPVIQSFGRFADKTAENLSADNEKKEIVKCIVLQVFSVMLCTALMPALFFPAGDEALHNSSFLSGYIRSVVGRLWQVD